VTSIDAVTLDVVTVAMSKIFGGTRSSTT
jgi:hypothetical protein